jgi:hypothetical protein
LNRGRLQGVGLGFLSGQVGKPGSPAQGSGVDHSEELIMGYRNGKAGRIVAGLGIAFGAAALAIALTSPGHSQDAEEIELVGPDIAKASDVPFRSDTVTIEVGGLIENFGTLEYKISMNEGDVVVYSWTASEPIRYEFHGHSALVPGQAVTDVHWYRIEDAAASHGSLVAPVSGIHGWYFANPSFDKTIEIELKLSGHYRLEPGVLNTRASSSPPAE